jgi:hypothetical protein
MFTNSFYHEVVRKTVVAFGSLFNNLYVVRKDNNGKVTQRMKVPLAYGPKQKFLTRLDQDAGRTATDVKKTSITLPRLGFEMTSLSYDSTRKLNRVQKFKKVKGADNKSMTSQFMPVPYNIGFTLYTMAKNSDDALQIVEQILPYFQPDYTVTLNAIPDMEIVRDVPIILNDVSYEDSYDGDFTSRRVIMYTMSFTAKNYLYGPVTSSKVIKQVQVDQYADMPVNTPKREQRLVVTPDPIDADGDDNFGFNETTSFFEDAKTFDPASGTDK